MIDFGVIDFGAGLLALAVMLAVGTAGWLHSYRRGNVTIVDSLWAMFFLFGLAVYATAISPGASTRSLLVLGLTALWALRLSGYLAWRNWGKAEDRRYARIRHRNEPGFSLKSLYLVFWLQAVLVWVIGLPLFAAYSGTPALGFLDYAGIALWVLGFGFESAADWQLARFKSNPANRGAVMDRGLWRLTRHPNYFGEACLWWGFWLMAAAAGGAWTIFAPILMTVLLLKISGVALLEKDIGDRRPAYRDYVARTNSFIPGPPRTGVGS